MRDFKNATGLLTAELPKIESCSCCHDITDIEDRGSYWICRRCKYSIDICGKCVLHPLTVTFRPELESTAAPTLVEVLNALGEALDTERVETVADRNARRERKRLEKKAKKNG